MCYLKIKDEQAAKAPLAKLVNEYADQTELVAKAQAALDDLMDFDPAALMPPDTLIYIELGSPGKQLRPSSICLRAHHTKIRLRPFTVIRPSRAPRNTNTQKVPATSLARC